MSKICKILNNFSNLLLQVLQRFNEFFFAKIRQAPAIQVLPSENIPNIPAKSDGFKKPEAKIKVATVKPINNRNDFMIISSDDEPNIYKSLLKTNIEIKGTKKLKWKKNKYKKPFQKLLIIKKEVSDFNFNNLKNIKADTAPVTNVVLIEYKTKDEEDDLAV